MRSMQVSPTELLPPDGKDFWLTQSSQRPGAMPVFSTTETSKVFYARGKLWLLQKLKDGHNTLDGELIGIPRGIQDAYRFQLYHVERMSHAFFERGIINIAQFENSLLIVKSIANNYRLI